MYIGNIISENKLKFGDLFNNTDNVNDIDKNLPTIIIGREFFKKIFPNENTSIIERRFSNNMVWTFSKRERRIDYEKDISLFMESCVKNINNMLSYHYVNILTIDREKTKKLINFLTFTGKLHIYIHNNSFIYIYDKTNESVIGIDFNFIDYVNIDRKRIYKLLYGKNNELFFDKSFIPDDLLKLTINNNMIIPYLHAIREKK